MDIPTKNMVTINNIISNNMNNIPLNNSPLYICPIPGMIDNSAEKFGSLILETIGVPQFGQMAQSVLTSSLQFLQCTPHP